MQVSTAQTSRVELLSLLSAWSAVFDPPGVAPDTLPTLAALHISKPLDNCALRSLAAHLSSITGLTELRLDASRATAAGLLVLPPALPHVRGLQKLCARIPEGAAASLAACLAALPWLQELTIHGSGAPFGPRGAAALASALGRSTRLKRHAPPPPPFPPLSLSSQQMQNSCPFVASSEARPCAQRGTTVASAWRTCT